MTILRNWSVAILATLALATSCTQSQNQTEPSAAATSDDHEMKHPGPELAFVAALHDLDLSADQRAAVENAMRALGPAMPAHHEIQVAIAAAARAGQLDEAQILAKVDASAPEHAAALTQALTTIHDTLTPDQRRALVDALGKKIDEHESMSGPAPDHLIEHLLSGLDLTKDQRAAVDAVMASQPALSPAQMQALHADLRARLDSFAGDRFDAAAFAVPLKDMGMRTHVARTLHELAAILPLLDQPQRDKLAVMIELMHGH